MIPVYAVGICYASISLNMLYYQSYTNGREERNSKGNFEADNQSKI
jgi:hypothetical protein